MLASLGFLALITSWYIKYRKKPARNTETDDGLTIVIANGQPEKSKPVSSPRSDLSGENSDQVTTNPCSSNVNSAGAFQPETNANGYTQSRQVKKAIKVNKSKKTPRKSRPPTMSPGAAGDATCSETKMPGNIHAYVEMSPSTGNYSSSDHNSEHAFSRSSSHPADNYVPPTYAPGAYNSGFAPLTAMIPEHYHRYMMYLSSRQGSFGTSLPPNYTAQQGNTLSLQSEFHRGASVNTHVQTNIQNASYPAAASDPTYVDTRLNWLQDSTNAPHRL